MTSIPLGKIDQWRKLSKEARIQLKNRYFEANPVLSEEQVALIARPGRRKLCDVGVGPIRGMFCSPGNFDDALFVVSQDTLYRVDIVKGTDPVTGQINFTPTPTSIGIINGYFTGGSVSFAATAPIGDGLQATPPYLYIADGSILWCYTDNGYAQGVLTATNNMNNNDVVRIGSTYYKFTTGSVDSGTPAGTSSNPWLIHIDISEALSLQNLYDAIDGVGTAGTQYSTALTPCVDAHRVSLTTNKLTVRSVLIGASGNATVTTETSSVLSWGAGTMQNGGTPGLYQIPTPNDVGMISLAFVKGYVICVPAQGGLEGQYNGRFYWIQPGENTISSLDFATAERKPDPIWQVFSFNDKFWFPGATTIEPWYPTGDQTTPMRPFSGVTFERGALSGTALQVKDSMVFVDPDGGVFSVGGGIKRISNSAIEERIREAMQLNTYLQETNQ